MSRRITQITFLRQAIQIHFKPQNKLDLSLIRKLLTPIAFGIKEEAVKYPEYADIIPSKIRDTFQKEGQVSASDVNRITWFLWNFIEQQAVILPKDLYQLDEDNLSIGKIGSSAQGQLIKRFREELNLTQDAVGDQGNISRIESGQVPLKIGRLESIVEGYLDFSKGGQFRKNLCTGLDVLTGHVPETGRDQRLYTSLPIPIRFVNFVFGKWKITLLALFLVLFSCFSYWGFQAIDQEQPFRYSVHLTSGSVFMMEESEFDSMVDVVHQLRRSEGGMATQEEVKALSKAFRLEEFYDQSDIVNMTHSEYNDLILVMASVAIINSHHIAFADKGELSHELTPLKAQIASRLID